VQREHGSVARVGPEHEQVGEVRAREQQRGGVGHEDRAVEERAFVEIAMARGVHEHRSQEDDGRVEVEQGRHGCDEREQHEEQAAAAESRKRQPRSGRFEQPVRGGRGADE
jgi:hypothetical protein